MSLMQDFQNCSSELEAWAFLICLIMGGIAIGLVLSVIFRGKRDTYYHGQIDAIRGIIKYKLKRNEDGEEVWEKIKDNKN